MQISPNITYINIRGFFVRKISLLITVFTLVSSPVFAQIAPKPGFAYETKKQYVSDPNIIYGQLPNGLRYAIQKWDKPEKSVSLRLRIAVGAANEDKNEQDLTHFLEHMAFNGSKNFPEGKLIPLLEKEGLKFGADTNAMTTFSDTTYQLDLPKSTQLDLGLNIFSDIADKLTLSQGAIDREKGIIEAEERGKHSPIKDLINYETSKIYDGMKIKDAIANVDLNIVRNATKGQIEKIYKDYYTPDRAFLVVVGDVDIEKTKTMIAQKFGGWSGKNTLSEPNLGIVKPRPNDVDTYVDAQIPNKVEILKLRNYQEIEDNFENNVKGANGNIAISIINERLSKIAIRNPTLYTFANLSRARDKKTNLDVLSINILIPDNKSHVAAIRTVENEIRKAIEFGFTDAEMQEKIDGIKLSTTRALDYEKSRFNSSIAANILSDFAYYNVTQNATENKALTLKKIPLINAKNAQEEFVKLWGNDNPQFFVTQNEKVDNIETIIKTAWSDAGNIKLAAPENEVRKQWEYTDFGNKPVTFTKRVEKDFGASYYKFSNNVNFIFKKHSEDKGKISITISFGEGKFMYPKEQKGLSYISDLVYTNGGLGKYDIIELGKLNAGKYISTGFGTEGDVFVLSGNTTKEDFKLQMQNLAAYFTDPAWRPQLYEKLLSLADMVFSMQRISSGSVYGLNIESIISPNDPRYKIITKEDYLALKLDDAKKYVNEARKNGPVEVLIVGDIEENIALDYVKQTFAQLPKFKEKPNPYNSERNRKMLRERKIVNLDHDGAKDDAMLVLNIPTTSQKKDGKEAMRLSILTSMLQIELTDKVREKMAGDYSPSVFNSTSSIENDFGYIRVSINPKPQEIDKFQTVIEEIIKDFSNGKFSKSLFDRSMDPILANVRNERDYTSFYNSALKQTSLVPEWLELSRNRETKYKNIKLDDIKVVAKKYLDVNKMQIIRVLPKEKSN